jgi:hypothetical protein
MASTNPPIPTYVSTAGFAASPVMEDTTEDGPDTYLSRRSSSRRRTNPVNYSEVATKRVRSNQPDDDKDSLTPDEDLVDYIETFLMMIKHIFPSHGEALHQAT